MGWEQRGGRLYYYRKRRDGDRVVSEYIGAGEIAELCADLDRAVEIQREIERQEEQARRAEVERADGDIATLADLLATLTRAVLVANGCHQHKGEWRRRRGRGEQERA